MSDLTVLDRFLARDTRQGVLEEVLIAHVLLNPDALHGRIEPLRISAAAVTLLEIIHEEPGACRLALPEYARIQLLADPLVARDNPTLGRDVLALARAAGDLTARDLWFIGTTAELLDHLSEPYVAVQHTAWKPKRRRAA